MCGICGFNWNDEILCQKMADAIAHRGPDSQGIFSDNQVTLGHRRLSIIDLSDAGRQPMVSSDGKVQLVFNGEIFNFQEIRKELELRGATFTSKSDTEVLLNAYIEYGIDFLEKLNGMFAFCIYDSRNNTLLLARDRIGIKPLYYYLKDEKLIFASEIKAILEQGMERRLNEKALVDYMTFQNILDDSTFFEGIRLLQPGKYMIFDLKKKKAKLASYWDLEFKEEKISAKDAVKEFSSLFEKAVERHMISDVPVGSYLSGGFDSGSVTAETCILTRKEKPNFRINTYTAKFKEGKNGQYDETICSRALARKYNAKVNEVTFGPKEFMKELKKVVYHLDEPKVGMPVISAYFVAKVAAKEVRVVMTGHGGDEFFSGYPVYKAFYIKSCLRKNPIEFFKAALSLKFSEMPRALYYLLFPFFQEETSHGLFIMFNKHQRKKLFTKKFYKKYMKYEPTSKAKAYYRKKEDMLQRLTRLYIKTYLPSMMIVEDKVSMAHSIESRIPFCDNDIVGLSLKVPYREKITEGTLKFIVKESMRTKLPKIYYNQPKLGFPTPMSLWLRNELKEYAKEVLLGPKAVSRDIFNQKYVKKLLEQHFNSKTDGLMDLVNTARIWSLLNVELWFQIFIDGEIPWSP